MKNVKIDRQDKMQKKKNRVIKENRQKIKKKGDAIKAKLL